MKKLIYLGCLAINLILWNHALAQSDFSILGTSGGTNFAKCGYTAFTNSCPPLVRYYLAEAVTDDKSLTRTDTTWFGECTYNGLCTYPTPVVGGSTGCGSEQTVSISGSCSFGDSDSGWSASGSADITNMTIIGYNSDGTTTTNVFPTGCGGSPLDGPGSPGYLTGGYQLGLVDGEGRQAWSYGDEVTEVITDNKDKFTSHLDPGGVAGVYTGDDTFEQDLSGEILTSSLLSGFGRNGGGSVGSASMSFADDQSSDGMNGSSVKVWMQGPKGNFRIPYVIHTSIAGINIYSTNSIQCMGGPPQYYPAGRGILINPPYVKYGGGCSDFYAGGSSTITFMNFICLSGGRDKDGGCSHCDVCNLLDSLPSSGSSGSGGGGSSDDNSPTQIQLPGMPMWSVSQPFINLWVSDTPVEYTTSLGEKMRFTMNYKQRDDRPSHFNGTLPFLPINGWNNNWSSYVHFTGQMATNSTGAVSFFVFSNWTATVYERGGGAIDYSSDQNSDVTSGDQLIPMDGVNAHIFPQSISVPQGGANVYAGNGFRLVHGDGSQDVYGLVTPLYPVASTNVLPVYLLPSDPTPVHLPLQWTGQGIIYDGVDESYTPVEAAAYGSSSSSGGVVVGDPTTLTTNSGWDNTMTVVYAPVLVTNDPSADALLTEHIDPYGNITTLNYTNNGTNYQLQSVVDYDGKTTTFAYDGNGHLSGVTMPYGHSASFSYSSDLDPALLSVTDAQGMSSSFSYINTNLMTRMITPYGTNTFQSYEVADDSVTKFNDGVTRAIRVGNPDGTYEMYAYFNSATNAAPVSYSTGLPTPPSGYGLDNAGSDANAPLYLRDSFYWGRKQCAALSTTDVTALNSLTPHDFLLGKMSHWKLESDDTTLSSAISLTQEASPDGVVAGQQTWYGGADQLSGANENPSIAMRLEPDGTTWYQKYFYDSSGQLSSVQTTYTDENGNISVRDRNYTRTGYNYSESCIANNTTNTWTGYWLTGVQGPGVDSSINNDPVDMMVTTNRTVTGLGTFTFTRTYPHWTNMDLNVESKGNTVFAHRYFNDREQLTEDDSPTGLTNVLQYGSDGFLQQSTALQTGAVNTYTFANGQLATRTDPNGLYTTYSWDYLDRLTGVGYPDGTTFSNIYTRLDITAQKDRLGNWKTATYDRMRRMTSLTDRRGNTTHLDYCVCGGLSEVIDPLTNTTTYDRNMVGWVTDMVYADINGDSTSRSFIRDALGRPTTIADTTGETLNYTYDLQDLATNISHPTYGVVKAVSYNQVDLPVTIENAEGVWVTNIYYGWYTPGLIEQEYASGITRQYHFNNGLMDYSTDGNGHQTFYGYDPVGRLTALTDANGNTNGYTYTAGGELSTLADGRGHVTTWLYDTYGREKAKVDGNLVTVETNGYDADGRVVAHWTPAKGLGHYIYDANGNLRTNSYSSGTTIVAGYDALNRIVSLVDAVGTSTFSYTNFGAFMGALATEDGPWASDTVTNVYQNRLRTGMTVAQPSGYWSQSYSYDGLLRPTAITSPAGTFGYSYSGAGMEVPTLTLPGGNSVVESYDGAGQLLSTALKHSTTTLESFAYQYDPVGNRTNVTRVDGAQIGYGYDNMNQLTSALGYEPDGTTFRGNENFGYGYDAANNLAARTNNTLPQAFANDNANELVNVTRNGNLLTVAGSVSSTGNAFTINGQPASIYHDLTFAVTNGVVLTNGRNVFTGIAISNSVARTNTLVQYLPVGQNLQYDANGNLVNDGLFTYEYDCANELTRVTDPDVSKTEYVYDGFGRRRVRRDYSCTASTYTLTNEIHYIYDGMVVVQERSNNVPVVSYTRGLDMSGTLQRAGGIGGLLARTDTNGTALYHDDALGNITMMIDSSGNQLAKYLYDPFGNTLGMWGTLANVNTYRYSSKEIDRQSGIYYYGFRYYVPNLQRWLNRDPIRARGGINLYGFVGNNPVDKIDIFGLQYDPNSLSLLSGSDSENGGETFDSSEYAGTGVNVLGTLVVLHVAEEPPYHGLDILGGGIDIYRFFSGKDGPMKSACHFEADMLSLEIPEVGVAAFAAETLLPPTEAAIQAGVNGFINQAWTNQPDSSGVGYSGGDGVYFQDEGPAFGQ